MVGGCRFHADPAKRPSFDFCNLGAAVLRDDLVLGAAAGCGDSVAARTASRWCGSSPIAGLDLNVPRRDSVPAVMAGTEKS